MKKIHEMNQEMIKACCLKCDLKLPRRDGASDITQGNFWAYGKTEVTKRYIKAAKEDLRLRKMHLKIATDKFHGDFGRVQIGGKMFSWYPLPAMLVRDDFGDWCERHIMDVWDFTHNRERLPEKDESGVEIKVASDLKMYKEIRKRTLKMLPVFDFVEPVCRNSVYDMKNTLNDYRRDIAIYEQRGGIYIATVMMADLLSAIIAYREKQNALAIDFLLDMSASALKAAQFVQQKATGVKGDSHE